VVFFLLENNNVVTGKPGHVSLNNLCNMHVADRVELSNQNGPCFKWLTNMATVSNIRSHAVVGRAQYYIKASISVNNSIICDIELLVQLITSRECNTGLHCLP
jgi:hypothetical protein